MTKAAGSAGAGRDGRLRELVDKWRRAAAGRTVYEAEMELRACADELDAILAVPDPLASETGQANEAEMQRLRNIGAMDVVSRFLADAVTWAECDLYEKGEGPSGGYRSRAARAREAHEAWLNRPDADPLASSSEPQAEKFIRWVERTPNEGLSGDSRVAYDAQVRVLRQLRWYLEGKDDYLNAAIDLANRQPDIPASDPLASSSEPQVTFSTTTVDGPSTAAPGMPTIGGSSLPVRASGEPQDDGTFHPQDFYRAGLLRAAEIAERMKRGPWGDPHDTITHEHLVEQIVAAILAAASLSDDGGRQPQDRFTTLLDEWKARYPIDQTGGSGRCYAAFISAHALVDDLRAAASDDGAAQLEQLKAFRPTTDQPTDADIADAGAARPQPAQEHATDIREIVSSYGFLLMRLAVAADAQDTFDVCKREFTEHEAALKRLQDVFIHTKPATAAKSDIQQKIATSILPVVETSRAARQGEASGGTEEDPQ